MTLQIRLRRLRETSHHYLLVEYEDDRLVLIETNDQNILNEVLDRSIEAGTMPTLTGVTEPALSEDMLRIFMNLFAATPDALTDELKSVIKVTIRQLLSCVVFDNPVLEAAGASFVGLATKFGDSSSKRLSNDFAADRMSIALV
jgi:hypothetical protein